MPTFGSMEQVSTKDNSALNTEEKIRLAALKVFTEKGFEATKTRDIAAEAGINIASLHYYYRSKEKLFEIVIGETMGRFSGLMDGILDTQMPLHQKIKRFTELYIDFLKENPFLPMFILSESQRNVMAINQMMQDQTALPILEKQIKDLIESGVIRPISIQNFMSSLVGLVIFPFLSKSLLQVKTGIDELAYVQMLEERKEHIPAMIINYLYFDAPEDE